MGWSILLAVKQEFCLEKNSQCLTFALSCDTMRPQALPVLNEIKKIQLRRSSISIAEANPGKVGIWEFNPVHYQLTLFPLTSHSILDPPNLCNIYVNPIFSQMFWWMDLHFSIKNGLKHSFPDLTFIFMNRGVGVKECLDNRTVFCRRSWQ